MVVTAWGHLDYGGSNAPNDTEYVNVFSNNYAFAALKSDGSIASIGSRRVRAEWFWSGVDRCFRVVYSSEPRDHIGEHAIFSTPRCSVYGGAREEKAGKEA